MRRRMPMRGGTPLDLLHAAAKSAADRSGPVTPSSPGTAVNASRANAAIGSRFARVIISLNGAMYAPHASTRSSSPDVARYGLFSDRTCRAEASGEGGLRARPRVTPMMRLFSASAIINSGSAAARNASADVYRITFILLSEWLDVGEPERP